MKAIYKKEVKSYLTSMIGYVFIFFMLLLEGIYFTAYNLQNAYPLFGNTLSAITVMFPDSGADSDDENHRRRTQTEDRSAAFDSSGIGW